MFHHPLRYISIAYRLFILNLLPVLCSASAVTTYTYLQTHGNRIDTATKVVTVTDTARFIHYEDTRGYTSESVCTPDFTTKSWSVTNSDDSTAIRIIRKGSKLYFDGIVKSRSVHRTKSIGTAPWLQAIEFALAPPNSGNISGKSFWIVRITDFSAHKMKFRKGNKNNVRKVSEVLITPSGIPARIWHATISYSQKDKRFISSLFPSLFPGKKATAVTLLSIH